MAANVKDYMSLPVLSGSTIETITKAGATVANAFLAYNRLGGFPAADGGYAAGLCTKTTPVTDKAAPIATIGYAIGKVKAGSVVAVDGPVAVSTAGELIPATGTNFVLGYAQDSSDGTGTVAAPHYIRIKLAN